MNIGLFIGSFKPPHKGHFEMVKSAIKKDKLNKVIIIISKNPRYLKDIIQNPRDYNIIDFENEFKREFKTKSEAYDYIKSVKSKYNSINAEISKKIWTIYLDFLKKKYNLIFDYIIKIGILFSPIINTNIFLKSEFKKNISNKKKNKYILYKSNKNAQNSRFDYLLKKYPKNLISKTVTMKYKINARDFRNAMDKRKNIITFLPKLDPKDIKKILFSINII